MKLKNLHQQILQILRKNLCDFYNFHFTFLTNDV